MSIVQFMQIAPEAALKPKEVESLYHISVNTLTQLRHKGGGPKYRKLGYRSVRYLAIDVADWIRNHPAYGNTGEDKSITPEESAKRAEQCRNAVKKRVAKKRGK